MAPGSSQPGQAGAGAVSRPKSTGAGAAGQLSATREEPGICDPVRAQEPEPPAGGSKGLRDLLEVDERQPKGTGDDTRRTDLPASKSASSETWVPRPRPDWALEEAVKPE